MSKPLLIATGLVLFLGSASAQETIIIDPDDAVLAERYVRALPEPPPVVEEHLTLRPGSVIPDAVPLQRFGGQSKLERYAYFLSVDGKVVIADPGTRVVVRILDAK